MQACVQLMGNAQEKATFTKASQPQAHTSTFYSACWVIIKTLSQVHVHAYFVQKKIGYECART
jgi:hypothetical protein